MVSGEKMDKEFFTIHDSGLKKNFFICDTTLRDGEQVTGVHYDPKQKLEIATLLDKLGIESLDAGFAATSSEERLAIKMISEAGLKMRVMSMCRVVRADIDHAYSSGANGVILFIPGSDTHIRAKFGDDIVAERKRLAERSVDCIKYAKDKGLAVEFGVEDSSRTEDDILLWLLATAENAGADWLGTTDTVGCSTPEKIFCKTRYLVENLSKPIGVHCHNDLGLATANTIAGIRAGAGYVSPTVNGIGERAGNASLEEVIMSLKVLYNMDVNYDVSYLQTLSGLVEKYSGVKNSPLKAVVGENAYSHESGIHIDGMLKDVRTYECFDPAEVGRERRYILGKHIGRNTVRHILKMHGYDLTLEDAGCFWSFIRDNEALGERYKMEDIVRLYINFAGDRNADR